MHATPPIREMDDSFRDSAAAVIEHSNRLEELSFHMLNTCYATKSLDERTKIAEKLGQICGILLDISQKMGLVFELQGGNGEQSLSFSNEQVKEDETDPDFESETKEMIKETVEVDESDDDYTSTSDGEYDWEGAACAPEALKTLWEWLKEEKVSVIGLEGDKGIGKTWIARHLVDRAVADNLFDIVLWVYNSSGREREKNIQKQIVDQLHCYINDEHRGKEDAQKILLTLAGKKYLLILDDYYNNFNWGINPFIGVPHPSTQQISSKVILVSSSPIERTTKYLTYRFLKLERYPEHEAWKLLKKVTGFEFDSQEARELAKPLLKSCEGSPGKILILAGVLKTNIAVEGQGESIYKVHRERSLVANLRKAHDLAINRSISGLRFLCEMLPSKNLRDCLCVIRKHHSEYLSVQAVITVWMISGCLDGFPSLEEAYDKGLDILKDLIDRHLLFRYDDFHIVVAFFEVWYEDFDYLDCMWVDIDSYKKMVVESWWIEDENVEIMIENFETMYQAKQPGESPSRPSEVFTVHGIQGCSIPCKIPEKVLVLHDIKSIPTSISQLQHLSVLVLRNCSLLETVNQIRLPKTLWHLTLSGASCLRVIPDEFLEASTELQHLDLSNNHQLSQIPSSLPSEMRFVNLSGCPNLKTIPLFDSFNSVKLLDLSETKVESMQLPLEGCTTIVLRNCCNLEIVPYLGKTPKHLDLSGSIYVDKFQDKFLPWSLLYLDLSRTRIVKLPKFSGKPNLVQLILRDCEYLEELPCLEFPQLEMLDLSGSTNFKGFNDVSLDKLRSLETLNLSATQVMKLPNLSSCTKLRNLIFRCCAKLETFPPIEALSRLEVIDLTGAISFTKFQCVQLPLFSGCTNLRQLFIKDCQNLNVLPPLNDLRRLEVLDLSGTMIAELSVSGYVKIKQLILKNCSKLVALPHSSSLPELEVLNLSDATVFNQLLDSSFGQMRRLQELNLSGTQVAEISYLSRCHDLRRLMLADCSKLATLPPLNELTRLEVVDLSGANIVEFSVSGCIKLRKLMLRRCPMLATVPPLDELTRLEVLNLSGTQVTEIPSLLGCHSLRKLILEDCSKLEALPSLDELTRLEVLDLSGTKIVEFSFNSTSNSLCQLSLRGCSNLGIWSFVGTSSLHKLDLSATQITKMPEFFTKLPNLRQLLLRDCSSLSTLPDRSLLRNLQLLDISTWKVQEHSNGLSKWTHQRVLKLLNRDYPWKFDDGRCFQKLHFCLFSHTEKLKPDDVYLCGEGFLFKDIYYPTGNIRQLTEEPDKFLKICGFQTFPLGIEQILIQTELLYLKNNDFITRLSDLGSGNVKMMRECWIEGCKSIESAIHGEETEENLALGRYLQNLWISKLWGLNSVFTGEVQFESFSCLKHMYIDCCPQLVMIFSSYLMLKNLEILDVRFCDKLENLFGEVVLGEQTLPNLKKLILWKLPKLHTICGGVLPSLRNIRVEGCLKLQSIPVNVNISRNVKVKGGEIWWNSLKWEEEGTKSHLHFLPI